MITPLCILPKPNFLQGSSMFRLLAIILISTAFAQARPTNTELAVRLADSLAASLISIGDTLLVRSPSGDSQLPILHALASRHRVRLVENPLEGDILILSPAIYRVQYSPIDDNSIVRTIALSISVQKVSSGNLQNPTQYNFTHTDTLSRSELVQVNAAEPLYLSSEIPPERQSFFSSWVRPAAVFATLAATVWLFFSVRSR